MQPLGGNNCDNSDFGAGLANAAANGLARVQAAPNAVQRYIYRSLRNLRSRAHPVQLVHSRRFRISVLGLMLAGGCAFLFYEGRDDRQSLIAALSAKAGFEASSLVVNGAHNLDMDIIKQKLATQLGNSLFDFDVGEARQHVLSNPWVEQARVRKVYPDTVVIDLVEREPVALWKADGVVNIISADGTVIAEAGLQHMRLPQVVGKGANDTASEFLSYISRFSSITSRAKAYVRVADRRWNIHLDNGPKIMLPEHDWQAALAELEELNVRKQLFERDIVQVDMRLSDRLVLKMSPEQAEIRKTAIEDSLKRKWHRI